MAKRTTASTPGSADIKPRRASRARKVTAPGSPPPRRGRRTKAAEESPVAALAPAAPTTTPTTATDTAPAPIIAAPIAPTEDAPIQREGPRVKQIVPTLPEAVTINLETAILPDRATWLRGQTGLVLGVAVDGEALISYAPVALPRFSGAKKATLYVSLSSERAVEVAAELRYLNREGNGYSVPSPLVSCDKQPIVKFPLQRASLGDIFTAALSIRARGAQRFIVQAVWMEIEG